MIVTVAVVAQASAAAVPGTRSTPLFLASSGALAVVIGLALVGRAGGMRFVLAGDHPDDVSLSVA